MAFLIQFSPPTEGVLHQERTVAVVNDIEMGYGCLYVTESCVSWLSESGKGFSLEYPKISLHAISRDASSYPKPCLYVMVDGRLPGMEKTDADGNKDEEEEDEEDEDDSETITEIRFVPDDATSLDTMHQAVCDGNVLHPDPDDSLSDEDDENFVPEVSGNGFLRAEPEGDDSEEMSTDAVDVAQFENADEEPMS